MTQTRGARPVTQLALSGKLSCGKGKASSSARKKKVRRLWGDGKGRFRTKGRYGAATVRGTKWLTEDRCNGTLMRVRQGVVAMLDFARKKTVVVKKGKSYLARRRRRLSPAGASSTGEELPRAVSPDSVVRCEGSPQSRERARTPPPGHRRRHDHPDARPRPGRRRTRQCERDRRAHRARLCGDPAAGTPHGVADAASTLAGFPIDGTTYAILTTGNAALADDGNVDEDSGVGLDGPPGHGFGGAVGNARDTSVLAIHLDAPAGAPSCVSFDFRFLSDEYPENVGLPVNDGFVAELDTQSVTTDDTGDISAPNNFAFDQNGSLVSINTAGYTPLAAEGTTYDGATQLLTASRSVAGATHAVSDALRPERRRLRLRRLRRQPQVHHLAPADAI